MIDVKCNWLFRLNQFTSAVSFHVARLKTPAINVTYVRGFLLQLGEVSNCTTKVSNTIVSKSHFHWRLWQFNQRITNANRYRTVVRYAGRAGCWCVSRPVCQHYINFHILREIHYLIEITLILVVHDRLATIVELQLFSKIGII